MYKSVISSTCLALFFFSFFSCHHEQGALMAVQAEDVFVVAILVFFVPVTAEMVQPHHKLTTLQVSHVAV
jgi:hypothetical protein